jgi:hypothetical protein
VVHLGSSISDDLDVFGEELVTVLLRRQRDAFRVRGGISGADDRGSHTNPKSAGKVFFFARSPEAPRTTMTVFSFSSIVL